MLKARLALVTNVWKTRLKRVFRLNSVDDFIEISFRQRYYLLMSQKCTIRKFVLNLHISPNALVQTIHLNYYVNLT